jgi:protein SCO1/2
MRFFAVLAILLFSASTTWAGLSRAALSSVSVALPANARLDLNLVARDTNGKMRSLGDVVGRRTAFLTFVDYTCNTLCGTDVELLAGGIERAHLDPSTYRILVLGIDPKDSLQSAMNLETNEIPPGLKAETTFLLPDKAAVADATKALGFHYVYDSVHDQFAHPAVVYVIAPDGGVRAVLSPFALSTADFKKIITASAPDSRSLYERIRLICYGYDPATGIYNGRISALLKMMAVLTILTVGGSVFVLIRLGRNTP